MSAGSTLGFIGVGDFARYLVAALRRAGDTRPILLSPRGAQMAAELADQHGARVMADNQAVIDGCDLLILCVRPAQAGEMLAGLRFREGQPIASAMAGQSVDALSAMGAPRAQLSLMLPPPSVAELAGPIALQYFVSLGMENPVVVSPDAGGVARAKLFKEGLEHELSSAGSHTNPNPNPNPNLDPDPRQTPSRPGSP